MPVSRVLPRDEWHRLDTLPDSDLKDAVPTLRQSDADILVVEDDDGRIVGHCAIAGMVHADGFWVSPNERYLSTVTPLLMTAIAEAAEARGSVGVRSASARPSVTRVLERAGGIPLPTDYLWSPRQACATFYGGLHASPAMER